MKNIPLLIGVILLLAGLVGVVLSQFSIFWVWLLVVLGIIVIVWTIVVAKKEDNPEKK